MSNDRRLVNINGEMTAPENAKISVFDRGFLYGDSLYEVIRTVKGKPFQVKEHMDRLSRSAALGRFELDDSLDFFASEMTKTIDAYHEKFPAPEGSTGLQDVYCRLIVTRGSGRIGFDLKCIDHPNQFVVIAQPLEEPTAEQRSAGIRLKISSIVRNAPEALNPAMKSGNYLNNLLAFLEASSEGFEDALLVNKNGHLTEGTVFNLFAVFKKQVITPPLDSGILEGITRRSVIQLIQDTGYTFQEKHFDKNELYRADEVFITGTTKGVLGVQSVDTQKFELGPFVGNLQARYQSWMLEQVSQ